MRVLGVAGAFCLLGVARGFVAPPRQHGVTSSSSRYIGTLQGVLSLSMPELTEYLGGSGRTKLVWQCYRRGLDPVEYYKTVPTAIHAPRQPTLGGATLAKLTPLDQLGTLSHTNVAPDGTTKLLIQLADGLQVETVIIPWKGQRSTLCISSQVGCRQGKNEVSWKNWLSPTVHCSWLTSLLLASTKAAPFALLEEWESNET